MGCSLSSHPSVSSPPTASSILSFRTISTTRSNQTTSSSLASKIIDMDSGSYDILDLERMRALLTDYMDSENRIQDLEAPNPMAVFYVKKSQLDRIELKVKDQLEEIERLKVILHSKRNLRVRSTNGINRVTKTPLSVHMVLERHGEENFSREEQEMLTAISKWEIATTELEMLYQDRGSHAHEVAAMYEILCQLSDQYKKQDVIVEKLGIDHGFNEDCKEEGELIDLESRRITISETYERWKESRAQLIQISAQFSMVSTNMDEAGVVPSLEIPIASFNGRGHYEIGEEIRDRLVSISQGLFNVKFLLKMELPYCTDDEMSILQKAMTYLFIDLRTEERRHHARECYTAFHRRVLALLAWVDLTIGTGIEPALEFKSVQIQDKIKILSRTRLLKISKQFPDLYNKNKRHQLMSPKSGVTPNEKVVWKSTVSTQLDPTSSHLLEELDISLLSQVPDSDLLFDSDKKPHQASFGNCSVLFEKGLLVTKDRTNRFTRKASMTNLTQMLGNIR